MLAVHRANSFLSVISSSNNIVQVSALNQSDQYYLNLLLVSPSLKHVIWVAIVLIRKQQYIIMYYIVHC